MVCTGKGDNSFLSYNGGIATKSRVKSAFPVLYKAPSFIPKAEDERLADKIREALAQLPNVEPKKMFNGLAFLVDGKMCINLSGSKMMCCFRPSQQETVAEQTGFREMVMKGKVLTSHYYVSNDGIQSKKFLIIG